MHQLYEPLPLEGDGEGEDDDGGGGARDDDDEERRHAGGEQAVEEHHVEAEDALHGEEAADGERVRPRHRHAAARHRSSQLLLRS